MSRKSVRYPKELSKPMLPIPVVGGLLNFQTAEETDAANAKIRDERAREIVSRMEMLREFYGVKNYFGLAYLLAEQVVPGLRVAKGRAGRPRSASPWEVAQVRCAADALIRGNSRLSVSGALAILSKREGKIWRGKSVPALKRLYYEASPAIVGILRGAVKWDADNLLPIGERDINQLTMQPLTTAPGSQEVGRKQFRKLPGK